MVFDEILPLYFTAPVLAGGLGITSADFAKALSFFGVMQLFIQFGFYPWMTKSFSTLTLSRIAFVGFVVVYSAFPELATFREWVGESSESLNFRYGYMFLLLFRFIGNTLAFTSLGIMVRKIM
jgi:hypothetical protein